MTGSFYLTPVVLLMALKNEDHVSRKSCCFLSGSGCCLFYEGGDFSFHFFHHLPLREIVCLICAERQFPVKSNIVSHVNRGFVVLNPKVFESWVLSLDF